MEEQALGRPGPVRRLPRSWASPTSLQLTPSCSRTDSKPTASSPGMGLGRALLSPLRN